MLLYLTIVGFLVTFLIWINLKNSNKSNIYLLLFLLINNIYALSHYATIESNNKYLIAIMLVHFVPFYLMAGPLLYFYVRGLLKDDHRLSKYDLLHFIPSLIMLINVIPYLIKGVDFKIAYAEQVVMNPSNFIKFDYLFISPAINLIIRPFAALLYVLASIYLMFRNKINSTRKNVQFNLISKWLVLLISFTFLLYLSFLVFVLISITTFNYQIAYQQGAFLLYATLISLIIINFSLLFFPNILYGLPQLDYQLTKDRITLKIDEEEAKKVTRSFEISEDKLQLLHSKIEKYILDKPFLNSNFNLTVMSAHTDIPVHHLSYYFNEYMKINFNTWKNNKKIEFVIELMENGTYENLTLDALSKQAGFGSRSSFIQSFKLKTGLTPSEYLQKID